MDILKLTAFYKMGMIYKVELMLKLTLKIELKVKILNFQNILWKSIDKKFLIC